MTLQVETLSGTQLQDEGICVSTVIGSNERQRGMNEAVRAARARTRNLMRKTRASPQNRDGTSNGTR